MPARPRGLGAILVNGDRLWADLQELAAIGRTERGISRLAFGPADMDGRRWLLLKLQDAGLAARMDQVGNVIGRLDGPGPQPAAIVLGSHLDTVPDGGMFDGALGVLAGLECVRTIREAGATGFALRHALEVVAFANEEGSHLSPGIFGSRALTEEISREEWAKVAPALRDAGLAGAGAEQFREPAALLPAFRREDYLCYLELHIEQGGVLDACGDDVGVVQGITCISSFGAAFKGEANHAGTTPMDRRKDALLGAAELVLAVPEEVTRRGSGSSVGTCGQVRVLPGGRNVIPGEAEVSVEVRDLGAAVASRIVAALRDTAAEIASRRGLALELTAVSLTNGATMDGRIQDAIEAAARSLGLKTRRMPSGAGHDAMVMARHLPCGMIFVPSRNGISHSPSEWTSPEQCVSGASVLLRTIMALDALV